MSRTTPNFQNHAIGYLEYYRYAKQNSEVMIRSPFLSYSQKHVFPMVCVELAKIILTLASCKSIHFSPRYARKTISTFRSQRP